MYFLKFINPISGITRLTYRKPSIRVTREQMMMEHSNGDRIVLHTRHLFICSDKLIDGLLVI